MRYVVIGASAAGISAVKKLRELNPNDEIILISKDTEVYSRCILYHYLDDTRTLDEMNFAGIDFDDGLNINWIKGVEVIGIDTHNQQLYLENDEKILFDKLCIAAGSHTNMPPIPGLRDAKNVVGFRNLSDAQFIKDKLDKVQNILVMGAGLVGVDVITGLLPHKKNIYLVDLAEHMMAIQLDKLSADTYMKKFEKQGVKQFYNIGVKEFILDEKDECNKVILQNDKEIMVDLVINCAGVRANIDFLRNTDIQCDKIGLIVDEHGQTNIKNIFGAGDVTGRDMTWTSAVKEGIVAAYQMSGICMDKEDYFRNKSSMTFFDIPTVSIGKCVNPVSDYKYEVNQSDNSYRKYIYQDQNLVGAIFQGDLTDSGSICGRIREQGKIQGD